MKMVKPLARRLIGDRWTGAIDYLRFADTPTEFDGPFNNQPVRQQMFQALVARVHPSAIIETGTFRGATAAFMAGFGIPVLTVEANRRFFGFARMRLRRFRNVTIVCRDSRAALRAWLPEAAPQLEGGTVLLYLDAHWHDDLPLAEELAIAFDRCPGAVVMIDDFQVPFDSGYGYDVYRGGKALEPAYIQSVVDDFGLCAFYPSTPSSDEGGARRGSVVLAKAERHGDALSSMPLLRLA